MLIASDGKNDYGFLNLKGPAFDLSDRGVKGRPAAAGLDAFVYWSKEKIGPRAVVSLTHVVISPPADGNAAIATKQIYASHYGHASLGLTILLDRSTTSAPRTRVIYVNRSRLDIFGGLFGSIKRPIVRSRAREGAERTMTRLRERVESNYRARR